MRDKVRLKRTVKRTTIVHRRHRSKSAQNWRLDGFEPMLVAVGHGAFPLGYFDSLGICNCGAYVTHGEVLENRPKPLKL